MVTFQKRYQENILLGRACKFTADVLLIIVFAYTLISFTCDRVMVVGSSMQPVFQNEDSCLVNRFAYAFSGPSRFDLVAFKMHDTGSAKTYVKRVVGLPGETVKIKNQKLYINGEELEKDVSDALILTAGMAGSEIKLGKDEYFVLGDNRNNSEDSRFSTIGILSKGNITGKVWAVCSPFDRAGLVK